ncbi:MULTISPECIES: hypothetical protein [unclassified Lysobacter]|uniref:hypothetical protein n=1 Tax=unclassified Lysobacter TaxID=2635362 RepID=UPI001C21F399|nr:hypothetical protein [Lysobacter sp. MMG2]MBU8978017.1 hypothetical protein [Lysobacter sp. MMG2]
MTLEKYFDTDDGSLPEVEVTFADRSNLEPALRHLYDSGGSDVSRGDRQVWSKLRQSERSYAGPADAALVASDELEPFHVVLRGVRGSEHAIPDLGVFVWPCGLTLDYRMGAEWGSHEIESFLHLLRRLVHRGGAVAVPWWGAEGEHDFKSALLLA